MWYASHYCTSLKNIKNHLILESSEGASAIIVFNDNKWDDEWSLYRGNLKNGKYFGSKTTYILHVIEYQHRGLPHVHIVYRLENGPDHHNVEENI